MNSANEATRPDISSNGHSRDKAAVKAAARATSGSGGPAGRGGHVPHGGPASADEHEHLESGAAQHAGSADALLGPSAFVGFGSREALAGLRTLGAHAMREPGALLKHLPKAAGGLMEIGRGRSTVAPAQGDKRFGDPAWNENRFYRALMQAYLYLGAEVDPLVDGLELEGRNADRARFLLGLVREALAPTNFLLTNPAAIKRAIDTGGGSLRAGAGHFVEDLLHNRGMPAQVDLEPFKVGTTLAVTPGAVIYRNEIFELIQYRPQTAEVYRRPLLVIPPQVNKFYALDLAPGRSMFEYLIRDGFQIFTISWRNPTAEQRDWGFDAYLQAVLDAVDIVRTVTRSPDVNVLGGCLGGMVAALLMSVLAARDDDRVHSATMAVTLLDTHTTGQLTLFAMPKLLAAAKAASSRTGVLDGWQTAQIFAWLRPNDLVWNYWVNNYLLGRKPPAFDILAWNADTTRLTSRFHHQVLDLVAGNQLTYPGGMTALGTPIDISRVTKDTYVAAGRTDHITPWTTCYRTTQMVSGASRFVLCSSGHIQTVVADPGHPRLGYYTNPATPADPQEWMAAAERHEGSWWEDYSAWLAERSGNKKAAPAAVGSKRYPAGDPAPGAYVLR
jgi:polyhydroxyalkanoate synthase